MTRHALPVTREEDFAGWYQAVVDGADLAEDSGVRGCMVIRPWGYGIWERMQRLLDDRIKATGHENCYFPLLIPISFFAKEAEHVEGFAKEMAVVTHHRLIAGPDGGLVPDPDAELDEPLVVRPTSETVIGAAFSRWVQSWRDLPVLINQWANIVRWEMRTRMFLRTSEFLWQEGHTAHASAQDARDHACRMLEVYREFAELCCAIPVIAGEKPENERFPGADATWSIEAMMQDGKALQAGTSHFLGTNFALAQNIRFQNSHGEFELANTTSWGMSTRMIGAVIMTHGDDDGLRVPPRIAPWQIVIIPVLRNGPPDEAVIEYCTALKRDCAAICAFGEPLRVMVDAKATKSATKRWDWIRKGAPLIVEIGSRDVSSGTVSVTRRDRLHDGEARRDRCVVERQELLSEAAIQLEDIQANLFAQAAERTRARIRRDVTVASELQRVFDPANRFPGWVEANWSRPTGAALDRVTEQLKAFQLTLRVVPNDAMPAIGACLFTGDPAVERILIGRAY